MAERFIRGKKTKRKLAQIAQNMCVGKQTIFNGRRWFLRNIIVHCSGADDWFNCWGEVFYLHVIVCVCVSTGYWHICLAGAVLLTQTNWLHDRCCRARARYPMLRFIQKWFFIDLTNMLRQPNGIVECIRNGLWIFAQNAFLYFIRQIVANRGIIQCVWCTLSELATYLRLVHDDLTPACAMYSLAKCLAIWRLDCCGPTLLPHNINVPKQCPPSSFVCQPRNNHTHTLHTRFATRL